MIAIKFENVSKQYQLGTIGTGTLSHDLNRWWQMNVRGKEDPYLKVGQSNTLASKEKEGFVWALRDINLRVEQGEVLGIIGKNGAGKSTLLKLLSRVTAPTTGRIRAWGRVASLLEVGTGFHPEMTGRENIYMNGSIMGMTKAEINRKFDEIVDFAGVERYIDTPVKRYSSGMTVRLGFAIAAHLEPEILVVDEVLAVGDAEFQKKAIGKMQDISTGQGRTVLFVSHNMAALQNLCKNGVLLNNGSIIYSGDVHPTIDEYFKLSQQFTSEIGYVRKSIKNPGGTWIDSIRLLDPETKNPKSTFRMGEDIMVEIRILTDKPEDNVSINIRLNDNSHNKIAGWRTQEVLDDPINIKNELICRTLIKNLNVFDGIYSISAAIHRSGVNFDYIEEALKFKIIPSPVGIFGKVISKSYNLIYTPSEWSFINR